MFWGVSKRIGGGLRIGIGGRIGASGSKRRTSTSRPSAAELRKQAKEEFLRTTESRFEGAINEYFLTQGYLLLAKDLDSLDDQIKSPIQKSVDEFRSVERLVRDGANLTDKRKEQMLENIYRIEDLTQHLPTEHSILDLYDSFESTSGFGYIFIGISLLAILIGLLWSGALWALVLAIPLAGYKMYSARKLKTAVMQRAIKIISAP